MPEVRVNCVGYRSCGRSADMPVEQLDELRQLTGGEGDEVMVVETEKRWCFITFDGQLDALCPEHGQQLRDRLGVPAQFVQLNKRGTA